MGQLDLFDLNLAEVESTRRLLDDLGLAVSIETGARYLMDARRKHYPTLLEEGADERERRVDYLRRSIDLAADLGAEVCSYWAGAVPQTRTTDEEQIWERLVEGTLRVLDHARERSIRLAFEPEPGMFVESPQGFFELKRRLGPNGADLTLCLDVGHCHCTGDLPVEDVIRATASHLGAVHLDDIRDGVHEHRMFGEGDLDLPSTLRALIDIGYSGLAAVELSRDSHRGALAAEEALRHVRKALSA